MTTLRELASVNGRVTPTAEAMVPMKDDGLYRGDGAFEVIRLYAGKPFALGDHLDRLQRSATAIELDFDRAALEREIAAPVSYTHLRAHETDSYLVCRLLLEKK